MKKIFLAVMLLVITATSFSQSDRYKQAMATNLSKFDSSGSADQMLSLSNAFERIGDAEKTQWLPYYYASLAYTLHAFMKNTPSSNDNYANKAEELINKAEALEKNNSEIACVKSMIASLRMLVDPQSRWQTFGPAIQQEIEKAKSLDPANPRPYFLQGQNLRFTPEEFGGGCATAKPLLEEAQKKFETFKPASDIHPNWGKGQLKTMLEGCK
jgi:hypothetical protein